MTSCVCASGRPALATSHGHLCGRAYVARVGDPIALVEAAYRLDLDDDGWLRALMAAAPWLDAGLGLTAYTYRIDGAHVTVGTFAIQGGTREMEAAARAINTSAPWEGIVRSYLVPCFATLQSTLEGAKDARIPEIMRRSLPPGVADVLGLVAHDAAGDGVVLAAPLAQRGRPPSSRAMGRARRLAAHVAAACRLRTVLREGGAAPDAVLTASGRVLHAEGCARDAGARAVLARAARARDVARGAARRRDPDGALATWTARVDARWSLVDGDERDGKQLVVARANEVVVPGPGGLAPRERQVAICAALGWSNKLIAYTLGIGESAVASSLASARRKLGYPSRVALTQALARLAVMPPRPPEPRNAALAALTPAEHEVLRLLVGGASNAAIARLRGRAERTVANQVAALLHKLGADNRAVLAARYGDA